MSRDPFDILREHNPMPEDRLPAPPMATADRIVRAAPRRRPLTGWALAAAAAVIVLIGGGAWMLWLGDGDDVVASDSSTSAPSSSTVVDTTTTTSAPGDTTPATPITTTTAAPTTTVPPSVPVAVEFPVYFFLADNGTENAPGPYLVPAMRTTAILSAPVGDLHALAVEFLLSGPTPGEAEAVPAMSSAVPQGTLLNGVTLEDGIATVDLSAEYTSGGGSFSMMGRLAQVVFTLTAFDDVDGVRFLVDGIPTTVFGGEGIIVDDPADRNGFEGFLPAVMIESPSFWGTGGNPLVVRGTANVFEATVSLSLVDGDGLILWEGFTTAACGTGCRGDWEATIPYDVAEAQTGAIIAWEASARDGSQTNVREHPVWLVPAGSGAPPTSAPSIDSEAAELRAALDGLVADLRGIQDRIDAAEEEWAAAPDDAGRAAVRDRIEELRIEEGARLELLDPIVDRLEVLGGDISVACSGTEVTVEAPEESSLPAEVAATRKAVSTAAQGCDWTALGALIPEGRFTSSFGAVDDPIAQWRRDEVYGDAPMRHLAGVLAMPYGVIETPDETYYVWPSASAAESWDQVSDAHRTALLDLYSLYDLAGFDQFGGYIGYRVGITGAGDWVYFVAGD